MATAAPANPVTQSENKNSRRKKGKAESATATPPQELATEQKSGPDSTAAAGESSSEHPYVRELHKTVRNVKKKIAATQKVDSIIADNPGKSLDELLSTKLINPDQKLQAERKPALKSQLRQIEEQLEHFKKFEDDLRAKFQEEKTELERAHAEEIENLKNTESEKPPPAADKDIRTQLLYLSKFLRTAAARRQESDEETDENRAFEGALLQVYGGDIGAVVAMQNVINGSEDLIPTVEGTFSNISYKQIKEASTDGDEGFATDAAWAEGATTGGEQTPAVANVQTDPTVAHAGLTEIDAQGSVEAQVNGVKAEPTSNILEATNIDSEAANATAEASWNRDMSASATSGPDGWVEVQQIPRDPAETDNGLQATPAANSNTQSWAEDIPTEPVPPAVQPSVPANDGFHEVTHRGGRGRGGFQGEFRGHRGRGGYRGDRGEGGGYRGRGGFRGDRGGGEGFRGRGRGGFRGPRGGRGDSAQ